MTWVPQAGHWTAKGTLLVLYLGVGDGDWVDRSIERPAISLISKLTIKKETKKSDLNMIES